MPAWNEALIKCYIHCTGENVGRMYANLLKYGLSANVDAFRLWPKEGYLPRIEENCRLAFGISLFY